MEQLTSSLADSPAKTFQYQDLEPASPGQNQDCGVNTVERLRTLIRNLHSLKTHLSLLEKGLKKSYLTFPKSGMMQNGNIYQLPILDTITSGHAFGFLPTPLHKDGEGYYICSKEASLKRIERKIHWIHHAILFYDLPKGIANPQFSEWLMGFPKDWTLLKDLEDVEMQ